VGLDFITTSKRHGLSIKASAKLMKFVEDGMESPSPYHYALTAFHLSFIINLVFSGQAVESPEYTLIHQQSDFEIRLYKDISWMSAPVLQATSFQKSTKAGFHRFPFPLHYNKSDFMYVCSFLVSL